MPQLGGDLLKVLELSEKFDSFKTLRLLFSCKTYIWLLLAFPSFLYEWNTAPLESEKKGSDSRPMFSSWLLNQDCQLEHFVIWTSVHWTETSSFHKIVVKWYQLSVATFIGFKGMPLEITWLPLLSLNPFNTQNLGTLIFKAN